jgi:FKBP-type peptidyl-prolyl cis-trans isomerase
MFFGEAVGIEPITIELPASCTGVSIHNACLEDAKMKGAGAALYVQSAKKKHGVVVTRLSAALSQAAVSLVFDQSDFPLKTWCKFDDKKDHGNMIHLTGAFERAQAVASTPQAPVTASESVTNKKRKATAAAAASEVASAPVQSSAAVDNSKSKKKQKSEATRPTAPESSANDTRKAVKEAVSAQNTPAKANLNHWRVKSDPETGVLVKKMKKLMIRNNVFAIDHVLGKGPEPKLGSTIGILYEGILPDGTIFDRTTSSSEPFQFRKGTGQVIRGLDIGLEGLRLGGYREIFVPAALG